VGRERKKAMKREAERGSDERALREEQKIEGERRRGLLFSKLRGRREGLNWEQIKGESDETTKRLNR
jgi:hypothetical protein